MSFYYSSNSPAGGSSGAATPTTSASASSSTFLGSSIYSAFGGLMRRLSSDPGGNNMSSSPRSHGENGHGSHSAHGHHGNGHWHDPEDHSSNGVDGVFNPHSGNGYHRRAPSPLQPPPLEPLVLQGFRDDTPASARLMNSSVAEEIRIMVPERLRIEEDWKLVYSLDQDGASLATLYEKCARFRGRRGGFVLVVRDDDGGTFGAYLTEAPHPSPHYFGTGECFLWRASLVASLAPPPSADTTNLVRSTTLAAPAAATRPTTARTARAPPVLVPIYDTDLETHSTAAYTLHADDHDADHHTTDDDLLLLSPSAAPPNTTTATSASRPPPPAKAPTPPAPPASPSVRFKAFPYSGVNEYYVYCEPHWLSVGGGDGKYGLWLDDSLAKGVSATCMTFGNEPLSDEGEKFGVLGVEVWVIGAKD